MRKKLNLLVVGVILIGSVFLLTGCAEKSNIDNKNVSTEKSNEENEQNNKNNHQTGTGVCKIVNVDDENIIDPLAIGTEYECDPGDGTIRSFYVLEVTGNKVYLISDSNIGGRVMWHSYEDDKEKLKEPKEAMEQLKDLTANWNKVEVLMPSVDQIIKAVNLKNFEACEIYGQYQFDSDDEPHYLHKYNWLSQNLSSYISSDEAMFEYWTSTPVNCEDSTSIAWSVTAEGSLSIKNIDNEYAIGVRPVILVEKGDLTY